MKQYGQYCPVSRAAEVLSERWTLLVIRELLWGNDRFNAIARGVPRMSPTMLTARLRELERAGIVERVLLDAEPRYRLTPAGLELEPLVEQFGAWGQRWMHEIRDDEFDPALLMLDLGREIGRRTSGLPSAASTIHLDLTGVPQRYRRWWLTFSPEGLDVCDADPGRPVDVWMETDTATLTRVWLGQETWSAARREERLSLHGDTSACEALPTWLGTSRFAVVPPASPGLPRVFAD